MNIVKVKVGDQYISCIDDYEERKNELNSLAKHIAEHVKLESENKTDHIQDLNMKIDKNGLLKHLQDHLDYYKKELNGKKSEIRQI